LPEPGGKQRAVPVFFPVSLSFFLNSYNGAFPGGIYLAVRHLFEIDFGSKIVRSIPLPLARIHKIFSTDPEISTEKFKELTGEK
jgi:hypothetical protein